jgi:L-ascorbate metabolism protein UlaG (beta-lactamase superfamily)
MTSEDAGRAARLGAAVPPAAPPGSPTPAGEGPQTARDAPGDLVVRWLGHASTVLDLAGARILTDPLLLRHAGLLRRRGERPERVHWSGPDAVLLSHLHHDHAELGSLGLVHGVPVLTGAANARWLRAHGVEGVAIGDRSWWRVPGTLVEVRLVPAVHGHRPMPHRPNAAHGFLVRGGGRVVWFAGDTAPYPAMADLPALADAAIDLALVPVGGWGPRLSGGHMDPVEAARACAAAGVRAAVPVHWGTLHAPVSRRLPPGWMDLAGPAFAAAVARFAPGCRVVVLGPGEALRLSGE